MGVGVVVESSDFLVTFAAVKRVGFGQRPVGVEAKRLQPSFAGCSFERSQDPARDAHASRGRRGPDPLDFSGRFVHELEPAAADRVAIEPRDQKKTGRRRHVVDAGVVIRTVEAALKTRRELAEIRAQAEARVGAVRRFGADLDRGGWNQSLDLTHRRQHATLRGSVEGAEHRSREIVRKPVIGRALSLAFARQAHTPAAPVVISFRHCDQSLRLQGLKQAAEIARVQSELAAERANVRAVGADFENEPRLGQRATASQIVNLERPDALGDQAIEAADALQLAFVHSLTLVRYIPISSPLGTIRPTLMATTQRSPTRQLAARQFVIGGTDGRPKELIAGRRQTALVSWQA